MYCKMICAALFWIQSSHMYPTWPWTWIKHLWNLSCIGFVFYKLSQEKVKISTSSLLSQNHHIIHHITQTSYHISHNHHIIHHITQTSHHILHNHQIIHHTNIISFIIQSSYHSSPNHHNNNHHKNYSHWPEWGVSGIIIRYSQ